MKPFLISVLCLGSAIAGSVVGYIVAERKLGAEFDARLERELDAMEKHYRKVEKRDEFSTPSAALAAIRPELVDAAQALTTYQGHFDETKIAAPAAGLRKNIFGTPKLDVDWELLKRDRTEEAPYVLTQDEYMAGELDYTQITLTYFAGDGVLVDERDDVIEGTEADELVGEDNLKRFGLQSNDPNVVYVRNHEKELDVEITQHEGEYAKVVLGVGT